MRHFCTRSPSCGRVDQHEENSCWRRQYREEWNEWEGKKVGRKKKQMARKFTLMGKIDAMATADVFPLKLSTTIVSLPWCVVWVYTRVV